MRWRLFKFIFFLFLFMSLSFFEVLGEETSEPKFELNDVVVNQGQSVSMSLYLYSEIPYGALEIEIYYDDSHFSVSNLYHSSIFNHINHQKDVYDNGTGKISYIFISTDEVSISGQLLHITFQTQSDTPIGIYPIYVAVNGMYDVNGNSIHASMKHGSITVNQVTVTTRNVTYNDVISQSNLEQGSFFTWTINAWDMQNMSASNFEIYYPKALLSVTQIELGPVFSIPDTLYDINQDVLGFIRIAFANTEGLLQAYPLLTITFEVLVDQDISGELKFLAINSVDSDFVPLVGNLITRTFSIVEKEVVIEYPSLFLTNYKGPLGQQVIIDVKLDQLSQLAAGDFIISYDPNALTFVSFEKLYTEGYMIINHHEIENEITFSIIHSEGIIAEAHLFKLIFSPKLTSEFTTMMSVSGSNIIDSNYNSLNLSYQSSTIDLKEAYDVTFINFNGDIIDEQQILNGELPFSPSVINREGTTFIGWDKIIYPASKNESYKAVYTLNASLMILENKLITYDGLLHNIPTLTLPEGASITYVTPDQKDVGIYEVEINFYLDGEFQNVKKAILEIQKRDVTITISDHATEEKLPLPQFIHTVVGLIQGDILGIVFEVSGLTVGTHTITATISNSNYRVIVHEGILTISPFPYAIGDVSKDSVISIKDVALIQLHLAQLITLDQYQLVSADFNEDGKISIVDIAQLQLSIANRISALNHDESGVITRYSYDPMQLVGYIPERQGEINHSSKYNMRLMNTYIELIMIDSIILGGY